MRKGTIMRKWYEKIAEVPVYTHPNHSGPCILLSGKAGKECQEASHERPMGGNKEAKSG